jgi:hypothetical protein
MGTFSRVFSSLGKGSHPPKLHLYLKVLGQNKKKGDHPDEETHTMLINMYAYKYIVHTSTYAVYLLVLKPLFSRELPSEVRSTERLCIAHSQVPQPPQRCDEILL